MRYQILLAFATCIMSCKLNAQYTFDSLEKEFQIIDLPINDAHKLTGRTSLNIENINSLFILSQNRLYYLKNDKKVFDQYFGQIMEETAEYDYESEGKNINVSFRSQVYSVGRLTLSKDFYSIIIKVIGMEITYYDIYNFSKEGELLSFLPLFIGYRSAPHIDVVNYITVTSTINDQGIIKWHENIDGLETFRTLKLDNNGYFEILKEEKRGESEY